MLSGRVPKRLTALARPVPVSFMMNKDAYYIGLPHFTRGRLSGLTATRNTLVKTASLQCRIRRRAWSGTEIPLDHLYKALVIGTCHVKGAETSQGT